MMRRTSHRSRTTTTTATKQPAFNFGACHSSTELSRRDALRLFSSAVCAVVLPNVFSASSVALAATSVDEQKKPKKGERGSKEAKGYQLCLSQCLYDCTTPKAGLAKERSECRIECKDECAVSREQL